MYAPHNHVDIHPHSKAQGRRPQAVINHLKKALYECRPDIIEYLLADYVNTPSGVPHRPFTQEQVQALAEKFKKHAFELTPALANYLQDAALNFIIRRHQYEVALRLSEERKDCEAFCDLFTELIKQLRRWNDPWIHVHFIQRITEPYFQDGKEINEAFHMLIQAEDLAQVLHRVFSDVLLRLPKDEGGRRKDLPLHFFILRLKEIWEKGTGKKAGRSRNPRTRQIEGPFVRFVTICLTYLEPDKPYSSLGETIHKVLQAETVTRHGKNLSRK